MAFGGIFSVGSIKISSPTYHVVVDQELQLSDAGRRVYLDHQLLRVQAEPTNSVACQHGSTVLT